MTPETAPRPSMKRGITQDERALVNHITRYGSDGYPVMKLGPTHWTWCYRSISGPPVLFKTKREAVASFEVFHALLLDAIAGRI